MTLDLIRFLLLQHLQFHSLVNYISIIDMTLQLLETAVVQSCLVCIFLVCSLHLFLMRPVNETMTNDQFLHSFRVPHNLTLMDVQKKQCKNAKLKEIKIS